MVKNRQTRQKELLDADVKKFKTFFYSEDLLEKISKKDKKIGIATIYRYLKNLREKDEIYSYVCNGKTIYSNSKKSHCHFECIESGKVMHFEIDNLDFLKDKIPGEIESFQIEVKGICNNKCSVHLK